MAGRISDRQKDRFLFGSRFRESLFSPRIPIHRIVCVLKQVGRFLANEAIRRVVRHGTRKHDPLAEGSGKALKGAEGHHAEVAGERGGDEQDRVEPRSVAMHFDATNVVFWRPRRPAPREGITQRSLGNAAGMSKTGLSHGVLRYTSTQRTSFSGGPVDRHPGWHHAEVAGERGGDEQDRVETRGVAMHFGATNVVFWRPRRPAPGMASHRGRWGTAGG